MDRVDALAVDLAGELRNRVDRRLGGPPVERVGPEVADGADDLEIGPVRPRGRVELIGPPRAVQAVAQIDQNVVGNVDDEPLRVAGGQGGATQKVTAFSGSSTAALPARYPNVIASPIVAPGPQ